MKSASALIQKLGGATVIAEALGIPSTTVASWKSRGSIPAQYWPPLMRWAAEQNVPEANLETLASFAVSKPRQRAIAS